MKYDMMKVFDCQDMPDDVREKFFGLCSGGNGVGNDCYISHWVAPTMVTRASTGETEVDEDHTIVDDWLLANGACEHEHVIIQHWW